MDSVHILLDGSSRSTGSSREGQWENTFMHVKSKDKNDLAALDRLGRVCGGAPKPSWQASGAVQTPGTAFSMDMPGLFHVQDFKRSSKGA